MNTKKVVHFKSLVHCAVGQPAIVFPVDHTNHAEGQSVSNTTYALTSPVARIAWDDLTVREFETLNTIYKRIDE